MRVLPVIQKYNDSINKTKYTKFESNNTSNSKNEFKHQYCGIASVDLAYVSMFDNAIAKDLKLMGLI